MIDVRLFLLQRASALIMVPLVVLSVLLMDQSAFALLIGAAVLMVVTGVVFGLFAPETHRNQPAKPS